MQRLINFLRKNIFVVILFLITVPAFYRMLRPGIYSMQDFHLFRLYEFDKCVKDLQIPCRWAPDAGLGYGEPLFTFYGQLSYAFGEVFHLIGFSLIDSTKILFFLSLILSAFAMFLLTRHLLGNNFSAILSATLYTYAPYRAVDVWVRGALPEAISFIFFPLIILFVDLFIEQKKKIYLLFFSLLVTGLILSHNLSFLMFLPILVAWILLRVGISKKWTLLGNISVFFVFSFLLAAFYILPVIFEAKYVTLEETIKGYFDFRGHFATIPQLLFSRYWGYGASVFGPEDGLNLSVGWVQWLVPLFIFLFILAKRDLKNNLEFLLLFGMGWFYLFLTHNKSTILWEAIPQVAYIQFPWRFLGVALFCFSLSAGLLPFLFKKKTGIVVSILISAAAILLNFQFFREDIWYNVDDSYFLRGDEWNRQRGASIHDFWPKFGHEVPEKPASGDFINYFPGWLGAEPSENGLIPSEGTVFTDTPIRKIGNIISLISICAIGLLFFKPKWTERL